MTNNIIWHDESVKRTEREENNGHKSIILWFTGLSGSGKSTIAQALQEKLFKIGCQTYTLDGDNIRHGLNKDLGFTPEDREENIRRIGEVANLFKEAGMIVSTSFISPYIKDRKIARSISEKDFIEIFVYCPLNECENRDPKGLYKKARDGKIPQFTGISAPYEEPENPEIVLDTSRYSVDECVLKIINFLKKRDIIYEN